MSDEQGWAAPGTASSGASSSPWASAPRSEGHQGAAQAPPAWTPPPKPGLIPLHPLSFGTIIGSSFRVMRRNPAPTFGLSVIINGVIAVSMALVFSVFLFSVFGRIQSAAIEDQAEIMAGSFGLFFILLVFPVALGVIAAGILQGILSLEVARATLGEKLRIRGLWRLAKGRIGTLILWALLTSGVLIAFVVVAMSVGFGVTLVLVAASPSTELAGLSAVVGLLIVFVIGLAFVALSVWLGTKTALTPSAIVLERLALFAAIRRSWQLTYGNFWRTFGIQALIAVMVNVATSVVTYPVSFIGQIVITLLNPSLDPTTMAIEFGVLTLVSGVLGALVGAVGIVMQSSSLALIYIDIRMRKEGLDLELLQYVEAKGSTRVENPYERLVDARTSPSAGASTGSPWA